MIETVPSGTVLHGRYRIERVLGSGGFGHVYLAVDLMTSQQYAVKEYLVTGASGQEQLKHEATVLSQLHNPHLPAFQDAFMERGRYYVVLNYIEGHDLTDLIRHARQRNDTVPIPRIMEWILAICDAVLFLHSQRPPVIHRDIKPDNIRITSNGTAILVDLGNAKAAADGARTLFFIRHQGTPGYAPPEQYPGGSGTDTRSDVYALGGTLYFALTAHEPPSVSVRNQSLQQGRPDLPTLQDILANNPPEESAEANSGRQFRLGVTKPPKPTPRHSRHIAQLGTLPPDLLIQLNRTIHKAMALRPKDRYQSVADLANDLKRVMGALPAPQQPKRPVDPHSTQPDLPMLYEAIQAAKENAQQAPSTPDAVSQTAAVNYCPRCNAPLAPKAAFCAQCGTPLGPSTPPRSSASSKRIPEGEQTLLIRPQKNQASMMASQMVPPHSQTGSSQHSSATQTGTSENYQAPKAISTMVQAPQSITSSNTPSGPQGPVTTTGDIEPAARSGFHLDPKFLIIGLIALIMLIAIITLIITMTHHGH